MARVNSIDHVQLAMPPGAEDLVREFYAGVLGLTEVPKPPELAKRGGLGSRVPASSFTWAWSKSFALPARLMWGLLSTMLPNWSISADPRT